MNAAIVRLCWFLTFALVVGLAAAYNSMLILAVGAAPLIAGHIWLAVLETRP